MLLIFVFRLQIKVAAHVRTVLSLCACDINQCEPVMTEAVHVQGAGTAIGELPPYFMARAARQSGADPDDEEYEEFEEMLEQAEGAQVSCTHEESLKAAGSVSLKTLAGKNQR